MFSAGQLDAEYFTQKLRTATADIKSFEETAAPTGFSLLWDETDKKYGYINSYTGEVTQGEFLFLISNNTKLN